MIKSREVLRLTHLGISQENSVLLRMRQIHRPAHPEARRGEGPRVAAAG